MGWLRKQILKMVIREIRESGIVIGGHKIIDRDGALTFIKER